MPEYEAQAFQSSREIDKERKQVREARDRILKVYLYKI